MQHKQAAAKDNNSNKELSAATFSVDLQYHCGVSYSPRQELKSPQDI